MNEGQMNIITQMLSMLNTTLNQILDVQMLQLKNMDPEDAAIVDLVHNTFHKFMSDNSWQDDYIEYKNRLDAGKEE